jgi:hypothetical protein
LSELGEYGYKDSLERELGSRGDFNRSPLTLGVEFLWFKL